MPSFVVSVKNERNGMFQKVADATDDALRGSVSLAGLWALSPDLPPTKAVGDALRPIYIDAVSLAVAERHDALLNVLSPKVAQITFPPPQLMETMLAESDDVTIGRIRDVLNDYPSAAGAAVAFEEVTRAT